MIEHLESDGKAVFFNNRTIAEKIGVSHESKNVQKMISRLTAKGYIKREHREINFKRKGTIVSEWKWCFNTVKSNLIHVENDDQGGVAEQPPITGVAEQPPLTGVAEQPPYINPSTTSPLTTTTTESSSSIFNKETDNEILSLRNKHIPRDDRSNEEFLKQCKFHIDNGKRFTLPERLGGLKNLIKKGYFETPASYPKSKSNGVGKSRLVIYSDFVGRIKSDIKLGLKSSYTVIPTFEEWDKNEPS